MKYLMLFSHSELGAHQAVIEADNDEQAIEKAHKRLEQSPCSGMSYEVFQVRDVVQYDRWNRRAS